MMFRLINQLGVLRPNRLSVAMIVAAFAICVHPAPVFADALDLPREHVTLLAPPFVHAHEQATVAGPKIVEFRLVVEEKPMIIDDAGTTVQAMTLTGRSLVR